MPVVNHMKLHLPLGQALTTLAWGMLEFESAYRAAGQWDIAAATLKRAARYLIKCHIVASDTALENQFVAQVDHAYWGRPEQQPERADIVGEAVSAMIAISFVLSKNGVQSDWPLAQQLQARARQLLAFAKAAPGTWAPPYGKNAYPSSAYQDELTLAQLWMCRLDMATSSTTALSAICLEAVN
ncbi:endoglucanase, partial [Haematococcus lacustris]